MKTLLASLSIHSFFYGAVFVGCGSPEELSAARDTAALAMENGLSVNGLSVNGLSVNGLPVDGVSFNGLATLGLTDQALRSSQFQSWFLEQAGGIPYTDMVMRYIVKCAVASDSSRSVKLRGKNYTWNGMLGLAPQWAKGLPIPLIEQQLVTACFAAHVNKFGMNVMVSLLGYGADGSPIPMGAEELTDYPVKEGCFFGNLFNGEGAFVGAEQVWPASSSSSRACAINALSGNGAYCSPMISIGSCSTHCILNSANTGYTSCTHNAITYLPITTRITVDQIYVCGDGICQASESCGSGCSRDNCVDCSPCP